MIKTNKQIILCLIITINIFCYATPTTTVKLAVQDVAYQKAANDDLYPVIGVNQEFQLNVIINNTEQDIDSIHIPGIEQLKVIGQSSSQSTSIINKKVSSRISHFKTVIAPQQGAITLGPVQIQSGGKTITSNTITLIVSKNQVAQKETKNQDHQNTSAEEQIKVLCKIKANKNEVVVGEPITLSIIIYTHGPVLQSGLTQLPNFDGFLAQEPQQVAPQQEVIDNLTYTANEVQFILTPLQPGTKKFNAATAQYVVPIAPKRKRLDGFGFDIHSYMDAFLGNRGQVKQIISNELEITVKPLPPYDKPVDGVGIFTAFQAHIDKQEGHINEPLMLSLLIEGQGNFDQIAIPKLKLAEWFKYYESKTDFTKTSEGGKKRFDFILQSTKSGTVQIPPQTFTYYDTKTKTYETLATAPLTLTIKELAGAPAPKQQSPQKEQKEPKNVTNDLTKIKTDDLELIKESSSVKQPITFSLPWWVFVALLFTLPCLFFSKKIFLLITSLIQKIFKKHFHQKQLSLFERELTTLVNNQNARGLYQFFLRFLAAKYHVDINQITEDWMLQKLEQEHWDHKKIHEFAEFFGKCMQLNFYAEHKSNLDLNSLMQKAKYWLILLNK